MAISRLTAGWFGSEWTRMASSSSRVAPRRTGREGGGGGETRGSISMASVSLVRRERTRSWRELNRTDDPGRGRKPPGGKTPGGKTPGGKKVEWARGKETQLGPGGMLWKSLCVWTKLKTIRAYFQLTEMSSHLSIFRHI